MKKIKSIPRTQIRYMLKRQKGRCAISGEKLSPVNVSVDHIFPLSRKEFENEKLYGKSWLVTSSINRLKGSLTLDELYQLIEKIKNHSINTKELFKSLGEKYKELPLLTGKATDEAKSTLSVWMNPIDKNWTIVATKNDLSCIVGIGTDIKLINYKSGTSI